MMSVRLRAMHPNELAVFRNYSIGDYAGDLMNTQAISPEAALAQAGQEFDGLMPGSFLRIIEADGCAVGVVWYLTEETDGIRHAFLNDFVIAPEHRRKGYASAALTALAQEVKAQGCTEIRLYVSGENHAARALYERCGYHMLRPADAGAYLFREITVPSD